MRKKFASKETGTDLEGENCPNNSSDEDCEHYHEVRDQHAFVLLQYIHGNIIRVLLHDDMHLFSYNKYMATLLGYYYMINMHLFSYNK